MRPPVSHLWACLLHGASSMASHLLVELMLRWDCLSGDPQAICREIDVVLGSYLLRHQIEDSVFHPGCCQLCVSNSILQLNHLLQQHLLLYDVVIVIEEARETCLEQGPKRGPWPQLRMRRVVDGEELLHSSFYLGPPVR